jgi:hypothetical protein
MDDPVIEYWAVEFSRASAPERHYMARVATVEGYSTAEDIAKIIEVRHGPSTVHNVTATSQRAV